MHGAGLLACAQGRRKAKLPALSGNRQVAPNLWNTDSVSILSSASLNTATGRRSIDRDEPVPDRELIVQLIERSAPLPHTGESSAPATAGSTPYPQSSGPDCRILARPSPDLLSVSVDAGSSAADLAEQNPSLLEAGPKRRKGAPEGRACVVSEQWSWLFVRRRDRPSMIFRPRAHGLFRDDQFEVSSSAPGV